MPAFINSPYANTRAAVMVAFLYFSGDEQGLNDGGARAIEIRTRPGSLLDPVLPAPVGACTSSTACALIEAVLQALGGADPDRAIGGFARRFRFALAGADRQGRPFIWHYFFNKGGTGGNRRSRRLAQPRRPAQSRRHALALHRAHRGLLSAGGGGICPGARHRRRAGSSAAASAG